MHAASTAFEVLSLPDDASSSLEPMGSKEKFWWETVDGTRYLFKYCRPGTGEHWSERVAADIAGILGVPCAEVELAQFNGHLGSASRSFVDPATTVLVHGNELLQERDDTYPVSRLRRVQKHTISSVLNVLSDVQPPPSTFPHGGPTQLSSAADWFIGYLLLDAVILNSDRHHENWAVLQAPAGLRQLAPSYDHASSLGRELADAERGKRLVTRDARFSIAAYVSKARSAFFDQVDDAKPLHPADAFCCARSLRPAAADFWLARLDADLLEQLLSPIAQIPSRFASDVALEFARQTLTQAWALLHDKTQARAV